MLHRAREDCLASESMADLRTQRDMQAAFTHEWRPVYTVRVLRFG